MTKKQYSYKCVDGILLDAKEKAYQERVALSDVINEQLEKYVKGLLIVQPSRKRTVTKTGTSSGKLDERIVNRARLKAARSGYSLNSVIEALLENYIADPVPQK